MDEICSKRYCVICGLDLYAVQRQKAEWLASSQSTDSQNSSARYHSTCKHDTIWLSDLFTDHVMSLVVVPFLKQFSESHICDHTKYTLESEHKFSLV
jgi:hypothetical protein